MEPTQTIELELGEHRVPVQIARTATVRSPHTGQPLIEIHGVASTPDPAIHEQISQLLREVDGRPVRSRERWPGGVARWRVSWNSYAESGGEHAYSLILREDEDLSLRALVVDGVELHPYEYREKFSEDELTLWAKLAGSRAEVLRLRRLLRTRDPFPVVRLGIHDQPRMMRFGVAEWSEHQGQIRYRLVLVDRDADLAEHPELTRIEEANTRSATAFYNNFVERLAELLERRGILPAAEIEAARAAARDELWPTRHEFWRVPDVDAL